jgi:far upstream element-binding protein
VSLLVHIPEELAGGVIGKGGQVIAEIRKNSGARVTMDHSQPHERLGTRVVTMSGMYEEVTSAESQIGEVLDRSALDKNLRNMVGIDLPLKLFLPEEAVAHIIGWEGATIREMEQRSQGKIDIAAKAAATRPGMRNISIEGLPSQVLRAQCLMAATVSEKLGAETLPFAVDGQPRMGMGGPMGGGGGGGGMMGGPMGMGAPMGAGGGGGGIGNLPMSMAGPGREVELQVMSEGVGVLIGRGGSTVKELEDQTGTRIDMRTKENQAKQSNEPRNFKISGSKEQILMVVRRMGELLDRSASVQEASRNAPDIITKIEGRLIGLVMGKGGSTIREIQDIAR